MPPLRHERAAWANGQLLIGVDEVGRGPLAGPVVAAAVCFPQHHKGIRGVKDSKQVHDRAERDRLAKKIRCEALAWGLGAASVREIGRVNIRQATIIAMQRALARCRRGVSEPAVLYIDGVPLPELREEHRALVQGDCHCHAIAAASILAKVARDRVMTALANRRPNYGWQTNVGYATIEHVTALRHHGLTPHHRILFCDTALGQRELFEFED